MLTTVAGLTLSLFQISYSGQYPLYCIVIINSNYDQYSDYVSSVETLDGGIDTSYIELEVCSAPYSELDLVILMFGTGNQFNATTEQYEVSQWMAVE